MSAFVPLPEAAEYPAPAALASDGFFPAIDLEVLRTSVRIDPTVTPTRLRESALDSVLSIARDLHAWRIEQVAAGYETLAEVPNPFGPQLVAEGLAWSTVTYLRAVASLTAADLADRGRDAGATQAGQDRADELETAADVHRRNHRWALTDLLGVGRSTIELI